MLSETVVNILCSFIQHEADTGDNKDSPYLRDTIRKLFFLKNLHITIFAKVIIIHIQKIHLNFLKNIQGM